MKNSVLQINKKLKKCLSLSLALMLTGSLVLSPYSLVLADDFVPIEDTEFYSNSIILDADDTGGDVTLQFGTTLAETIKWDYTKSSFDLSGDLSLDQNQLKDVAIDNLSTAPTTPTDGQIYYNTTDDTIYMWDGATWKDVIAEPHAASHTDGTDDIQDATESQKGLMTAQHVQDLGDVLTQSDEINRNTIDVQLTLGENVASSVAYLTYDNPDDTTFVANIENVEYTINDNPATGIALTGGSDASPTLNYVYVRESGGNGIVEASTTDPSGQAFDYVPMAEVLIGTVGVSSATYYYVENLTNYIRNFIGDTNNRLRVTGVIYLSGIALTNTGLEIATTQGKVIHMHEEITYTAKDTTTDDMIDFYYNAYGALDNVNYDDGAGGNTAIGNNKFHKLFIWGDIYGGLHMERQQKPATSEYTSIAGAEDDTDSVAINAIPNQWGTVGFPIAHLILQQGTADVLKIVDLRAGGAGGGTVAGGHTQNTDIGTTVNIFTLDLDDTNNGVGIKFGNTLDETLIWDATNTEFDLSDDLNLAQAQLRGAAMDNLAAAPGTPVAGQIYHNTTNNNTYVYNGTSWEDVTIDDFEKLYTADADNTITTSNGTFTINTGTDDFIVTSNDWSVDTSGNIAGNNITSDGTLDANGVVTIGDGGDTVAIDSSAWDISSAGAASGLTTINTSGNITTSAGDFIIGTTGLTETTAADDSGAYLVGTFDEFDNSASANVQDVLDDLDNEISNLAGTNSNTFTMDEDDTGGNVTLQFGTALAETLLWDNGNTRFTFSDDVRVAGNLAVIGQGYIATDHSATDSDGILNLGRNSSAWENLRWNDTDDEFELSDDLSLEQAQIKNAAIENLANAPGSPVTGQIYHNTTDGASYIWNGSSWDDISAGAGSTPNFEQIYGADPDNTLTTSNGAFTINTGTNDFIVTSNDWSVDASGNLTVNGTMDANGVVTIGDGGDNVTIDSTSWDVSSAGIASGLTGITSTGSIDFTAATSFRVPQATSDPGTCSEGQQYYNTATNELKLCTATNTWSGVGSTTGANYVYAYDTTTQTVATADTFQDVTFNTNVLINGWTHTAGTANFTAGASGLYMVTVDTSLAGSNTSQEVELRALFNGVEIAGSQMSRDLTTEYENNTMSSTFLVNATASQILKVQFTGGTTNASIAPGGVNATTRPSIKITIVRIN